MTEEEMERLTAGTDVKSERIRILYRKGVERADIARFMGVQYSYVQNILKRSGLIETAADRRRKGGEDVPVYTVRVEPGGRIALPDRYLEKTGLREGEVLVCREGEGGLVIMNRDAAAAILREAARERMPGEAALLEALLDDPFRSS